MRASVSWDYSGLHKIRINYLKNIAHCEVNSGKLKIAKCEQDDEVNLRTLSKLMKMSSVRKACTLRIQWRRQNLFCGGGRPGHLKAITPPPLAGGPGAEGTPDGSVGLFFKTMRSIRK